MSTRCGATQQKISGCLASDDAAQDRLDIRSYLDTARKHGKNAMDVTRAWADLHWPRHGMVPLVSTTMEMVEGRQVMKVARFLVDSGPPDPMLLDRCRIRLTDIRDGRLHIGDQVTIAGQRIRARSREPS